MLTWFYEWRLRRKLRDFPVGANNNEQQKSAWLKQVDKLCLSARGLSYTDFVFKDNGTVFDYLKQQSDSSNNKFRHKSWYNYFWFGGIRRFYWRAQKYFIGSIFLAEKSKKGNWQSAYDDSLPGDESLYDSPGSPSAKPLVGPTPKQYLAFYFLNHSSNYKVTEKQIASMQSPSGLEDIEMSLSSALILDAEQQHEQQVGLKQNLEMQVNADPVQSLDTDISAAEPYDFSGNKSHRREIQELYGFFQKLNYTLYAVHNITTKLERKPCVHLCVSKAAIEILVKIRKNLSYELVRKDFSNTSSYGASVGLINLLPLGFYFDDKCTLRFSEEQYNHDQQQEDNAHRLDHKYLCNDDQDQPSQGVNYKDKFIRNISDRDKINWHKNFASIIDRDVNSKKSDYWNDDWIYILYHLKKGMDCDNFGFMMRFLEETKHLELYLNYISCYNLEQLSSKEMDILFQQLQIIDDLEPSAFGWFEIVTLTGSNPGNEPPQYFLKPFLDFLNYFRGIGGVPARNFHNSRALHGGYDRYVKFLLYDFITSAILVEEREPANIRSQVEAFGEMPLFQRGSALIKKGYAFYVPEMDEWPDILGELPLEIVFGFKIDMSSCLRAIEKITPRVFKESKFIGKTENSQQIYKALFFHFVAYYSCATIDEARRKWQDLKGKSLDQNKWQQLCYWACDRALPPRKLARAKVAIEREGVFAKKEQRKDYKDLLHKVCAHHDDLLTPEEFSLVADACEQLDSYFTDKSKNSIGSLSADDLVAALEGAVGLARETYQLGEIDGSGINNNYVDLLALLREAHYRISGHKEWLRLEQMIPMLLSISSLRGGNSFHPKYNLFQMDTGEGKSLVIALEALVKHLITGERCRIFTHNDNMAADGQQKIQKLASFLDVDVGLIDKNGTAIKKDAPICYHSIGQAILHSLQEEELCGMSADDLWSGFAIVDEVDAVSDIDHTTILRLARPGDHDNKEVVERLQEIIDYSDKILCEYDSISYEDFKLELELEYRFDLISNDEDMLWSAYKSYYLYDGDRYTVAKDANDLYHVRIMHKNTTGQMDLKSQWLGHLHLAVALRAQKKHEDKEIALPLVCTDEISSSSVHDFFNRYYSEGCSAYTATLGSQENIDGITRTLGRDDYMDVVPEVYRFPRAKRELDDGLLDKARVPTGEDISAEDAIWPRVPCNKPSHKSHKPAKAVASMYLYSRRDDAKSSVSDSDNVLNDIDSTAGTIGYQDDYQDAILLQDDADVLTGEGISAKSAVSTHLPLYMRRYDFKPRIFDTDKERYEALLSGLRYARSKKESSIIFVETVRQAECLQQLLHDHGFIDKVQIFDDTVSDEQEDGYKQPEALIKKRAGEPGYITIATAIGGRGVDFPSINNAFILSKGNDRWLQQILGRIARNGNFGVTYQMYLKEDCDEYQDRKQKSAVSKPPRYLFC